MSSGWGGLEADPGHSLDGRGAWDRESSGPDLEPDHDADGFEEFDGSSTTAYAAPHMTVPGRGEQGRTCGDWAPKEFCDECGEPGFGVNRCERRGCPECATEWTAQRAVGATTRLAAAREVEDPGTGRRLVHGWTGPPQGEIETLEEFRAGYQEAYARARDHGVRGGVVVGHGFRVLEETQQEFREADPDMGIWRWLLEEREENWRELTYWSPHYHFIGLCRDFEADTGDDADQWRTRRIRSFKPQNGPRDREAFDDMVGGLRYVTSHATYEEGAGRNCVRWFGELARNKFSPEEELTTTTLRSIEEVVEEVVGHDRGDGDPREEEDECENCGARSWSSIYQAGAALADPGWVNRIGREQEKRLVTAFKWAIGDMKPPPGLKRPTTEEQCRETYQALLEQ